MTTDLEAIRARDAEFSDEHMHTMAYGVQDRRALLAYVAELREAAGKVTCAKCDGLGRTKLVDSKAIEHLRQPESQRQLDEDGVEVGISRQAVDEAVRDYDALAARLASVERELALIAALQAGDGSTINGPTRDDFGRAFRMAQDIARTAMGESHE